MPSRSEFVETVRRPVVLVPSPRTGDATSSAIDTLGFEEAGVVVSVGSAGITFDAATRVDFILQVADTSTGTYTPVPGNQMVVRGGALDGVTTGVFATLDAPAKAINSYEVAYIGSRRFLRCVLDYVSTHGTATTIGISGNLGRPNTAPVTAS